MLKPSQERFNDSGLKTEPTEPFIVIKLNNN